MVFVMTVSPSCPLYRNGYSGEKEGRNSYTAESLVQITPTRQEKSQRDILFEGFLKSYFYFRVIQEDTVCIRLDHSKRYTWPVLPLQNDDQVWLPSNFYATMA